MILGGGASVVLPFSATGGTITTSGGYTIHTFTGSGTFGATNPPIGFQWNTLSLLVGEVRFYGGGGAGGMRTGISYHSHPAVIHSNSGRRRVCCLRRTVLIRYFQPLHLRAAAQAAAADNGASGGSGGGGGNYGGVQLAALEQAEQGNAGGSAAVYWMPVTGSGGGGGAGASGGYRNGERVR